MTIVVAGAGGFIGGYLVRHLVDKGLQVKAIDVKPLNDWYQVASNAENVVCDLREKENCYKVVEGAKVIYNLAADMGGMGFIENNKAACMLSSLINTHLLMAAKDFGVNRYFFSSSACVYAAQKQTTPNVTALVEADAYPAQPEDGYGWEKLFGERMCRHFSEDFGIQVSIARFHNVYGPFGTFDGGREKAPAAICRKVAEAKLTNKSKIEIWGDGEQTRSFTYIDDCIKGIDKLMSTKYQDPINLGSSQLVTINNLVKIVEEIAGVCLEKEYDLSAPQGVRGRNSDNTLIKQVLNWEPSTTLFEGMKQTYMWIENQVVKKLNA
ncbi:MAG: NAD-dependent epimerase/dehydratase family protein [Flavobacteriia bacterium]|nr:NAD-dependent epimerase/dehydratase family protein [Flavobacteriia bacterium]